MKIPVYQREILTVLSTSEVIGIGDGRCRVQPLSPRLEKATVSAHKMKIVSGGQTGVDRAALDFALKHRIECGGWCPTGRQDEFGRIPDRYPVRELPGADFDQRTFRNIIDSDGTVIFHSGEMRGGTEYTLRCCIEQKRPHLVIDAAKKSPADAGKALDTFIRKHNIKALNVAGPRQSEWTDCYEYTLAVLETWLQTFTA
jgi:putative molybdenum carrier protein